MQKTILKEILCKKKQWIDDKKIHIPIKHIKKNISIKTRNFIHCLKKKTPAFILECKKSSPSLGIINKKFDLKRIARVYKKYSSVISVVTEENYFHGNIKNISIIRNDVKQPILCKDFIFDPYQIYLSRYYQADAVLLILSILNDSQYIYLSNLSKKLNLGILTEISNLKELKRALKLNAQVIGINNRNLKDFSININQTKNLSPFIKNKSIIISESGISKNSHIKKLSSFVNGFLIGSSLMKAKNLELATKKIIFGHNKICGLTRYKDAEYAKKYGATYGGLIFCKNSPRKINKEISNTIIKIKDFLFVGVFQNQKIDYLLEKIFSLNLKIIQLHGEEDIEYIKLLKKNVGKKIKIWKSINVKNNKYFYQKNKEINKYLFDNHIPGSGKSFDWNILRKENKKKIILSGGLNIKNCKKASHIGCFGLDFNSGVEKKIGIKDKRKIKKIFCILRNFEKNKI
ncbi:Tryptophan biosynthesis protein TrpCF [Buchnera aphidicola (Sipha maydis)]|uniref:bifunctional indole-3-glycerol-phosphate synthase TrpC/phosphoribosylanthranilate isomerase TrpF n=1 Tax=Buchnera aphidicola TaxID=9 RepID=UPI002543EA89|nr:bifunctional indole-3-glycerol-phosphate synthase TrpC/phosphoribosylanthranilate isomerase TrpF [Buchnera aphidicola]WII23474.1 bifunctional indole-3-glycerol-phosphate synthase TrpC/phosphoribosylanthranilate isomerase TrpF [Buchnera aphidicola (Sipha maydis)]